MNALNKKNKKFGTKIYHLLICFCVRRGTAPILYTIISLLRGGSFSNTITILSGAR